MGMKRAIFLLIGLSIVCIIVQEVYQSRSNPKLHLIASKSVENFVQEIHINREGEKNTENHGPKGGWMEEEDIDHLSKEKDEPYSVFEMKSWKNLSHDEANGTPIDAHKKVKKKKKRKKYSKVWKEEDYGQISEEERLRISPYIVHEEEEMKRLSVPIVEGKEVKYISHFLPWDLKEHKKHPTFEMCRYTKCAFIDDMTKADLVAFKAANIRDHEILSFKRPPGQRWVMYTVDPAIRRFTLEKESVQSRFNATMTYNLDADIQQIFGRLQKVPPPQDIDYDQIYEGKTKNAAWFVSHCITPSRREEYVKRMEKVMDIGIYGICGNLSCGTGKGFNSRNNDNKICLPLLTKTYKFYLAFENAFCMDYLTEKFFKLFKDVQIVPVVRGGFQYKKYLPSGIFVDADDFKSPEELSEYLIRLGNDKERYIEMLRKKEEWTFAPTEFRHCLLCEYIHSDPSKKVYEHLDEKFGKQSCWFLKTL